MPATAACDPAANPHSSFLVPHSSFLVAHPAPSAIPDFVITLHKDAAEVWARFMVSPSLVPQLFRTIDRDGDGTAAPGGGFHALTPGGSGNWIFPGNTERQ